MGKPDATTDPELVDFAPKSAPADPRPLREELGGAFRWLVAYPAAGLVGLVVAVGAVREVAARLSAERLSGPVAVKGVEGGSLVLADGRRAPLRFLRSVPVGDPAFKEAVAGGVEVDGRGNAFGLLTVYPSCGMTLCGHRVTRVSLNALAAAIDPACVDGAALGPEVVAGRVDDPRLRARPGRKFKDYDLRGLDRWRQDFEAAEAREQPRTARLEWRPPAS